jgi:Skp family chaperone for outer membrane proteins
MAGGKASPRQKMINMMYLVLTALLAMNVSAEILQSFVTIANSLQVTAEQMNKKNNELTHDLLAILDDQAAKGKTENQ